MKMFEVGGCVRDELLGVVSKDIDFSVVLDRHEWNPIGGLELNPFYIMVDKLQAMGIKIFNDHSGVPIGAEFQTARGQAPKNFPNHPGRALDFVLARKESGYSDGRHPDKVVPGTLLDDLARRDFRMNAIAKDSEGNLIDPFNGLDDIKTRIIRAVGDPMERLTEDALRAVRALRFSVTKGFFIDVQLANALHSSQVATMLERISDERIQQELSKMFRFDSVASMQILNAFPKLTSAIFSGSVSLDATMKTKGRG